MDRKTALNQLSLMSLQCNGCKKMLPVYRILIISNLCSKQNDGNSCSSHDNKQQILTKTNTQSAQQKLIQQKSYLNNDKNDIKIKYVCISCFSHYVQLQNHQMFPFQEIALKYIQQMPLPDLQIQQRCLSLIKQIEESSQKLIKQIMNSIDQFKFYILRVCSESKKNCQKFIDKVNQLKKLKIQDKFILESKWKRQSNSQEKMKLLQQLRKKYYINQTEQNVKFTYKLHQLLKVKQKISSIKLTFPSFKTNEGEADADLLKRKNILVSDVPISSMITMKGKNYYGCSDGHIIFPNIETGKHSAHKGHDSLIRSFSHDNQFTLYTGSDDFTIKGWDVRDRISLKLIRTFGIMGQNKSYHRNISVLEHGKSLVSTRGQFDSFRIRVWDLQNQQTVNKNLLQGHTSFIKALSIVDKQKNTVITISDDKTIKLWQINISKPIICSLRPRKCSNLIVSSRRSLCCLVEEQNKITILDLLDNLTPIMIMTLPRKILCSCGYSRSYLSQSQLDYDYFVLCLPNNIGIWTWDLKKIKSIDIEVTHAPTACMQNGDRLIINDGGGIVQQIKIGNIEQAQNHYRLLNNMQN